jgi:hypothetical protein
MLDYDALRAKVKKLTEKPDKDPAKLPRTEKETEMVSLQAFLTDDPFHLRTSSMDTQKYHRASDVSGLGLAVPSPPKVLQRPEIARLRRGQAHSPSRPIVAPLDRSSNLSSQACEADARLSTESNVQLLQRSLSMATQATALTSSSSETIIHVGSDSKTILPANINNIPPRAVSMTAPSHSTTKRLTPSFTTITPPTNPTMSPSRTKDSLLLDSRHKRTSGRSATSTPLMAPSELELLQPFKEESQQKQADSFAQAKAAYEQLNEQLTSELPQLIDLR